MKSFAVIVGALLFAGATQAQQRFVNFESSQVHPLEISADGATLVAVNTADQRLEIFEIGGDGLPAWRASVPVGLEPVSVRLRDAGEAWVVNSLSDSISIVDLATRRVTRTVLTGDEPADVVFAGTPRRAYVSLAASARLAVYDPANPNTAPQFIALEGKEPRALAVSPDGARVHVAFFESGNATTIIDLPGVDNVNGPYGGQNPPPNSGNTFSPARVVANGPPPRVAQIVRRGAGGQWFDDNGRNWSSLVTWNVHDHDIASVDTATQAVSYTNGLMTTLMALSVMPDGRVAAVGTEALNQVRFEPNVKSIFLRVKLGAFDPAVAGSTQSVDLNPQLDYATRSVSQAVRNQAIGDPRGIVWHPGNGRAFVSGLGSNNVIVTDASGQRLARIDVGQGPTGLALGATGAKLYVLNKFDASISTLDTTQNTELARTPFYDPTPQAIKAGRPLLYDTHATSGLGQVSCASCHIDGRSDFLAWDLGDPTGTVKAINQACRPNQTCNTWHPMKGPMVTQSLQGITSAGAMHWRGDRENVAAFAPAFVGLQGRDIEPTSTQMQQLNDFIASIVYPPNPNRNLDGTYPASMTVTTGTGNPANGEQIFRNQPTLGPGGGGVPCLSCHTLPIGTSNQIDNPQLPAAPQPVKTVQLRGLWKKVGWSKASQNNAKGFGFNSDSEFDTLDALLQAGFNFGPNNPAQRRRDVEAFLLTMNTETHATVGQQITFDGANNGDAASLTRLNTFIALADTGSVGLIAKATVANRARGYVYATSGVLLSDRYNAPTTIDALRAAAAAGAEVTFTVVPAFTQYRAGVDRDSDGWFDADEQDLGADPQAANATLTGFCKADFDGNGTLDNADLSAFTSAFNASNPRANFDLSLGANGLPSIDVADQSAYQNAYAAGCGTTLDNYFADHFE